MLIIGLSGGEKKRLAIGNEIIDRQGEESYIFADEPTSGLDSYQAERVVTLLADLAKGNCTVLCSIHQPRASVFNMFDDISLLSEGRVVYSGETKEMIHYFEAVGYPLPKNVNPAEYYIDLVSIDYSSSEAEKKTRDRVHQLADKFLEIKGPAFQKKLSLLAPKKHSRRPHKTAIVPTSSSKHSLLKKFLHPFTSALTAVTTTVNKFRLLYGRAWKQVTRDKILFMARFMSSLFSGLLFGVIYYKLGLGAHTVPDRLGLLQVAAINTAMSSLIKATTSFVTEKLIVQKERRRGAYTVVPYFMAKVREVNPL